MTLAQWSPADHPYGDFLHEVRKPARYIGGEYDGIVKPWDTAQAHVLLAFPDAYEIGMSHLGLRILYQHLNEFPSISAERVFAPWIDLEAQLRARGLPLVSLENARPARDFDIVGFSLQYELTYTNILAMLDLSGIPLRSSDRGEVHPLIVAGGPGVVQPEPLAPFIDAFLIGDGERYFPRLIETWMRFRKDGLDRRGALVELAKLGGIYVPALHALEREPRTGHQVVGDALVEGLPRRVRREIVSDLDDYPFPVRGPEPSTEAVFDRFSLEIARGCTEGCRFCQAGIIYRPTRERSPDTIVRSIEDAVRHGGFDEVSLTALSTADFSCISPLVRAIMERLKAEKVSLAVSSLRAYGLSDELLESISSVRNTSLTFAPEAGTQRLRDVINKNISESDMLASAHSVFSRGWRRCKLYFMIGLPTEEDEDVVAIAQVARRYVEIGRSYHSGRRADVTVSVSTHVPKPHTPFQWAAMDGIDEIRRKQAILQAEAASARVGLKWHDASSSLLEGVLARGDRRVADLVEYAFRAGARFDGWNDQFRFEIWTRGMEALDIDPARYLGALPVGARLPWDHIDVGVEQGHLEREYRNALTAKRVAPCLKPLGATVRGEGEAGDAGETRRLVCFQCGIRCDLERTAETRSLARERMGGVAGLVESGSRDDPPAPLPDADADAVLGAASEAVSKAAMGPVAAEPAKAAETDAERRLDRIRLRNLRPRTAISNRPSTRTRILYERDGHSRFLSHLDFLRLLPRILRRAGLRTSYSLGFHPKPKLSFCPPLVLGWASRGEVLEVHLEDAPGREEVLERMDRAAPEGIRFIEAASLEVGDLGLSKVLDLVDYEVGVPRGSDGVALEAALEKLRVGGAEVDRAGLAGPPRHLEIAAASILAAEAGEDVIRFRFRLGASPIPRPDELAALALGRKVPPTWVRRTGFWKLAPEGGILGPLALEGLRLAGARGVFGKT